MLKQIIRQKDAFIYFHAYLTHILFTLDLSFEPSQCLNLGQPCNPASHESVPGEVMKIEPRSLFIASCNLREPLHGLLSTSSHPLLFPGIPTINSSFPKKSKGISQETSGLPSSPFALTPNLSSPSTPEGGLSLLIYSNSLTQGGLFDSPPNSCGIFPLHQGNNFSVSIILLS